MTYQIDGINTGYRLRDTKSGSLARNGNCEVFITRDPVFAQEAADYLNQPRTGIAKRAGSHRVKSTFGTL